VIQTATQDLTTVIGLGELQSTRERQAIFVCLGLGSCIAFCAHDPVTKTAGMAHLVLPDSTEGRDSGSPAKFVDLGIPRLLHNMVELGALKSRLVLKIVGGAHMMATAPLNGHANIGDRNSKAAKTALAKLGLTISGEDIGGNRGRTVRLNVESGLLTVSTSGGPSHEL
jgi:chemotaxis protein CheD